MRRTLLTGKHVLHPEDPLAPSLPHDLHANPRSRHSSDKTHGIGVDVIFGYLACLGLCCVGIRHEHERLGKDAWLFINVFRRDGRRCSVHNGARNSNEQRRWLIS